MRFDAAETPAETPAKTRWRRRFESAAAGDYTITVDTAKQTIDYPRPITLGDTSTSNFDKPENFVVLDCVCRLLEKGYDPATLILEKRYQVGRGASGGKSDITVLRRAADPAEQADAAPLLIIECKTRGREHDIERQKTITDGGQLFGYLQQDRAARHLCIYSSWLKDDNGDTDYRCDIIHVGDTREALAKFAAREKAENHTAAREAVPLFKHAGNRESLHHAWTKTYGRAFQSAGVFEPQFTPYAIGYKPLTGEDLLEFNGENGSTRVFNNFMEILRHNNVSDKENAFNRLCAVILAKLIDEERDPSAILDFQWFPDKDTAEDLIDRLQRLYKRGMEETLGETITYFEEKDIDEAFKPHRRDMAKNQVKKIFRALKFYTNNDFAFKEVHNKKLFEQNTRVVREVVQLFQGYRLKYTSKQAFLGNLFELLLGSGFKQSEGQFFTPIPIARFIVRCLPLRERMSAAFDGGRQNFIPRVMDYACGSAHFLTEAVEEIQQDMRALGLPGADNTAWTRDTVWGVEKDYRLARTAKIAMFLHGAGDANILHEDGLAHTNPKLPDPGTVDILIANPPYAIKDFKQHLQVPNHAYTLLPELTPNSSEIEVLFVERAAQLLRPGGLAGIILPSSILSNAGVYRRARALLLEKFLLRGVVELGGSTFIATGTNTIILFLERRSDTHHEHFTIRADILFNEGGKLNDADFADSDLLRAYCQAAGLDFADYCVWLADPAGEPPAALAKTPLFAAYADEFNNLAATKNRRKQASFQNQQKAEQDAEMRGKSLRHAREAECEKFVYFALSHVAAFNNGDLIPQRTTVLRSAGAKTEEQAFLGYKWSQRRGAEGMVYLHGDTYDGGALYTPDGRDEPPAKAAHYIRAAFLDTEPDDIQGDNPLSGKLRVAATPAYFDFSRAGCDLIIRFSPAERKAATAFDTRYESVPLGKVARLYQPEVMPKSKIAEHGRYPVYGAGGLMGYCGRYNHEEEQVVIGCRGTCGNVYVTPPLSWITGNAMVIAHNERLLKKYAEHILIAADKSVAITGAVQPQITRQSLSPLLIPLPPLDAQQRIVNGIEEVEAAEAKARDAVSVALQAIESVVKNKCAQTKRVKDVCELVKGKLQPSDAPDDDFYYIALEHIQGGTGKLKSPPTVKGSFLKSQKAVFAKNDVLYGRLRPYLNKVVITDAPGVCSTDLLALRCQTPRLLQVMLMRPAFVESAKARMKGVNHPRLGTDDFLQTEIPWPKPSKQQALLKEIAKHQAKRAAAEAELAAAPGKKRRILLDGLK